MRTHVILYIRVSTDEQVDNFSLKTQEDICKKEAERREYVIDKIFKEEGRSAKDITGRPKLLELLEYCRTHKNIIRGVIAYRLDRISRQTGDYLAIRKKLSEYGIAIISATEPTGGDSPTEKLVETILAGFAQLDNDIRAERSRNGMRTRFNLGLRNGYPPPGYLMLNAFVLKDKNNFDQIKKAWDIMATGTKNYTEMAQELNNFKLKNPRNGKVFKFSHKNISRIFRSKFYAGVLTSPTYKVEVQGQHIPMISLEQFYKVQAIIDGKNPHKVNLALRNRNNADFPLRRFITCSKCICAFTGSWSRGRCKRYAYYHCRYRCGQSNIPRDIMHESFMNLLKSIRKPEGYTTISMNIFEIIYKDRTRMVTSRRLKSTNQIYKLRAIRQALIDKNLSGVYSDNDFKEQFSTIESQLQRLGTLSQQIPMEKYTSEEVKEYIQKRVNNLPKAYNSCNIKQKRALINLFFPRGLMWNYPGLTAK